jgi:hypothetical protein
MLSQTLDPEWHPTGSSPAAVEYPRTGIPLYPEQDPASGPPAALGITLQGKLARAVEGGEQVCSSPARGGGE